MVKSAWDGIMECMESGHDVTIESCLPRVKRAETVLSCWDCEKSWSVASKLLGKIPFIVRKDRQGVKQ